MNMFKKNGGFTLVELIVVIAILAILAGVAVPAYSGYIKKANEASDLQVLAAVNTAAMATYAQTGDVTCIHVTVTNGTITAIAINGTTASPDALALAGTNLKLTSDTYKNGAVWQNETWAATGTCTH